MNNKTRWAYSLWIFNVSNLGILSYRKQAYFISRKILHEKVLLKNMQKCKKCNWFWKEKHVTINKKRIKITRWRKQCYIWGKGIQKNVKDINYRKVRHHCHYTGKYRGAAHSICNLKFKVPNEIPVFFNKDSNYDYHFIIKEWVW